MERVPAEAPHATLPSVATSAILNLGWHPSDAILAHPLAFYSPCARVHGIPMVTAGVALGSSAMGFRAWSAYVWLDPVSSDAIGLVAACASVKTGTSPGDISRGKAVSRALEKRRTTAPYAFWLWPNMCLDNHAGLAVIPHNWVAHGSISQSKPTRDHKVSHWGRLCLSPRNDLFLQKHCHIEALP